MATRIVPDETARFRRWPGLLSLSLGVLLGPILVLVNEGLIYVSNMWACGVGKQPALHIIPVVCLVVTGGAGWLAYRDWRRVGRGIEEAAATIDSRTRFLALAGMGISALSALVILAQWLPIFVFGSCMRA
jgi:hypothetical protein